MKQRSAPRLGRLRAIGRAACGLLSTAFVLSACDASGGADETEPTYEQAEAIAQEQLAGEDCEFQVDDETTEGLEQKTLNCLTTEGGQDRIYTIFQYSRDLEVEESDQYFGGLTTADRYFENGNITVDPSGGDPTAVQLDAEEFATALKEDCGCGEVLTPE